MPLDDVSNELRSALSLAAREPRLTSAAAALQDNDVAAAERLLKAYLYERPYEVAAIRMLAEVAARVGRYGNAETLLRRSLDLEPGFHRARLNLASVLLKAGKFWDAYEELARLDSAHSEDPHLLSLKAAICARLGRYDDSIRSYEAVLRVHPDQAQLWVGLGHVLKTIGRQSECVAAYRRATRVSNGLGDAWWSLANLKTVKLGAQDITSMESGLGHAATNEDRYHLHFALGKAYEDQCDYGRSFSHYETGNAMRRTEFSYDRGLNTRRLSSIKSGLTPTTFQQRRNGGCASHDPIFIVGLPRSGSTLIEQVLASHSQVEGTMELPDVIALTEELTDGESQGCSGAAIAESYTARLLQLGPDELRAIGERYLERTRRHRTTGKPYFTDKMPNNFAHVGFIHIILPNAKIIDARREPLATCFSCFKQHFSRGQLFTYDLTDLGNYYRDYVDLMEHFDTIAPGLVHRVVHERLIDDPEKEIRSLLAYCGLPFEEGCLNFHFNQRPVRTASSEQVRTPIHRRSLDQWRHFEPWLDEIKMALGSATMS